MAAFTVVIPARYGSTRLPGKVLAMIGGRSMLEWVWQRARASGAREVLIATDDERVASVAESYGAGVVRTRADHVSGTLRIAEVAEQLDWPARRVVVNVQADEPFLDPALIDQVAGALAQRPKVEIATLAQRITTLHDLNDVSAVKVVTDREGLALYFSRAMIPWPRDGVPDVLLLAEDPPWRRHVGVYAYRASFLREYARWKPAPIEALEGLEQLRALWHGARIHVGDVAVPVPGGVDTPEDLARVRALAERGGLY
jgi:3-deoxy-manno-octulosonate cytidylyltransferase (CMP-KDO synthetase)